jgi:hypothetical protein
MQIGLEKMYAAVGATFVVAVSAVGVALAGYLAIGIYDFLTGRKEKDARALELERMRARVGEAGRWLSWYFPIAEDIEQYILGERGRIDGFRDELWAAYGKRDTSEPVAATKEAVKR